MWFRDVLWESNCCFLTLKSNTDSITSRTAPQWVILGVSYGGKPARSVPRTRLRHSSTDVGHSCWVPCGCQSAVVHQLALWHQESPRAVTADILHVCLPLRVHVCVRVYVLSSRYIPDREVICTPFITFNRRPLCAACRLEGGRCFSGSSWQTAVQIVCCWWTESI